VCGDKLVKTYNEALASASLSAPDPSLSNSLTDLAARIRAEHEAAEISYRKCVQHALVAGELLTEAKGKIAHGRWLPWLEANCGLSERTAQRYMRLFNERGTLEANTTRVSDLSIRGGLNLLAKPDTDQPFSEFEEWFEQQIDGPFNDWDLANWKGGWLTTKFLHQAKVPAIPSMLLRVEEMEDIPVLRLCPYGDLVAAFKAILPFDDGDGCIKIDCAKMRDTQNMAGMIRIEACVCLGKLIKELKHRKKITDEQYQAEREDTHRRYMARCDEKLALLREITS
jgi:Protein of unknown function (DUF3102)